LLHEQDWIGCGWCGALLQVEVLKKVPDADPVSLVLRLLLLWEVVQLQREKESGASDNGP
jgi:hypothetical protein